MSILPRMGNRLKALRNAAGWTHERAAEAMGVSRSQFIKLERNERSLTIDYIYRAANAFNVNAAAIISDDDTGISGEDNIRSMLRRIDGLNERGVELALLTITTLIDANLQPKSSPNDADDQSSSAKRLHESLPFRSRSE